MAEITLYGEIGYWPNDLQTLRGLIGKLPEGEEITLRINSPGGSVIEGFAIMNLLDRLPNRIVAWVDGWAASMASAMVMIADEVHAPENAWLMIHKPWAGVGGDADELRKMADVLDKMEEQLLDFYMRRSKKTREEIKELVDAETWLTAKEAFDLGFVTHLEKPAEMAASWVGNKRLYTAPEAALAAITNTPKEHTMQFMDWLKACPITGGADAAVKELAGAELIAAHKAEIDTVMAQVAAAQAERDSAIAEAAATNAKVSEIETALQNCIADASAKIEAAEAEKVEIQARLDKLMGGMKKPQDGPVSKQGTKPATSHYLSLVAMIAKEIGGEPEEAYDKAAVAAQAKHPEEFKAMLAEVSNKR